MGSDVDRLKSGLVNFIKRTTGQKIIDRVDYLAHFPCKVTSQNNDGSLELIADDIRVGTFSSVPIRYGVPGISAIVPAGARCWVDFSGADPRKPIVIAWESSSITSITFSDSGINLGASATHPLIFGDDFSAVGGAFDILMQALAVAVGTSGTPAGATAAAASIVSALSTYRTSVLTKLSGISKTA